jgi:uncharacterized protein
VTLQAPQSPKPETAEINALSGLGEVYSYTVVTEAPEGYEEYSPYILALVKLDDGPLLTAQITDIEGEPEIGMRVEVVTRRLKTEGASGVIAYGYKFRPVHS